jgi:hypothetical protein
VNLDFADALGRRLLSARRLAAALRVRALVLADMCDDAVGMIDATASNGSRPTSSSPYALSSSPLSLPSWPSVPFCPPSHDRWRCRNSAVANRRTLHSDYYSTTQKTANPLNEWWMTIARRAEALAWIFVRPDARIAQSLHHRGDRPTLSTN